MQINLQYKKKNTLQTYKFMRRRVKIITKKKKIKCCLILALLINLITLYKLYNNKFSAREKERER